MSLQKVHTNLAGVLSLFTLVLLSFRALNMDWYFCPEAMLIDPYVMLPTYLDFQKMRLEGLQACTILQVKNIVSSFL